MTIGKNWKSAVVEFIYLIHLLTLCMYKYLCQKAHWIIPLFMLANVCANCYIIFIRTWLQLKNKHCNIISKLCLKVHQIAPQCIFISKKFPWKHAFINKVQFSLLFYLIIYYLFFDTQRQFLLEQNDYSLFPDPTNCPKLSHRKMIITNKANRTH